MTEAAPTPIRRSTRKTINSPRFGAGPAPNGADEEQHRGDLHDEEATEAVGEPAGCHRAGGRAQQDRGDGETEGPVDPPRTGPGSPRLRR